MIEIDGPDGLGPAFVRYDEGRLAKTADQLAWSDVRQYHVVPVDERDRVLDLGGNIGTYARWALAEGAEVVTVEPEPSNVALLRKNADGPRLTVIEGAAVQGDRIQPTQLYLHTMNNSHCTRPTRGRDSIDVRAYGLGYLLDEYRPTVLKCDVEGDEYELEPHLSDLPDRVRGVILEFHTHREAKKYRGATLRMTKAITARFPDVLKHPDDQRGWCKLLIARRERT